MIMAKNKGYTVEQLREFCDKQIKAGNGKRHILISADDEGNGYHELFYSFGSVEDCIAYHTDLPYGVDFATAQKEYIVLG